MEPIHLAARKGRAATCSLKSLLQKGVSPNSTASSGEKPLYLAISTRQLDIRAISALVKAGADVNDIWKGSSLLEYAIMANCSDSYASLIVQLLLQAGANPSLPTSTGGTLVDLATEKRPKATADILRGYMAGVVHKPFIKTATYITGDCAETDGAVKADVPPGQILVKFEWSVSSELID